MKDIRGKVGEYTLEELQKMIDESVSREEQQEIEDSLRRAKFELIAAGSPAAMVRFLTKSGAGLTEILAVVQVTGIMLGTEIGGRIGKEHHAAFIDDITELFRGSLMQGTMQPSFSEFRETMKARAEGANATKQ